MEPLDLEAACLSSVVVTWTLLLIPWSQVLSGNISLSSSARYICSWLLLSWIPETGFAPVTVVIMAWLLRVPFSALLSASPFLFTLLPCLVDHLRFEFVGPLLGASGRSLGNTDWTKGRRVARDAAEMPIPTSTVLQRAMYVEV
jgi:hypothetical protein